MAYNEELADRVRAELAEHAEIAEKKMFGGLSFIDRGNMCCGVVNDDLVVRVGPDGHQQALSEPRARPMNFTGRPMKGMVFVGPGGYRTDDALAGWAKRGRDFTATLPAKGR